MPERKTIGLGLLGIAGAIDDAQWELGHVENELPVDIDRLNRAFVAGDLTLNQYIAKLETLEKLAKDRTDQSA